MVESQLVKALQLRIDLLAEQDKLEFTKQTIVSIRRSKEVDQMLKETNANILKFKQFLKPFQVFRD